jgi:hypothetical protein
MTHFKWTVTIKQSVEYAGEHGEKLSAFVRLKDGNGNDLLEGNDIDQHQYRKLRAVAADNMDAIARRIVLAQGIHIPLDKSEKE